MSSPRLLFLVLLLSVFLVNAQGIGSDMCGNLTVLIDGIPTAWNELAQDGHYDFPGRGESYLRPDSHALLPWVYTAIVLVVHIPLVIVRVVRWETVQTWCLATTLLTVMLYSQAYASTHFSPSQILVWTPLLLQIDAGSMAQIFFLIDEDYHLWARAKLAIVRRWHPDDLVMEFERAIERIQARTPRYTKEPITRLETQLRKPLRKDLTTYIALSSFLLLVAIVILQTLGVVHSRRALQSDSPPLVRWCSPIFQPFGLAVRDGDCNVYQILQTEYGVGCIHLPGVQQVGWLKGTLWGTIIGMVLQTVDICILAFVSNTARPRLVRMRRPWCTMFCGIAVLAIMLIFGILYAQNLPPGITAKVWIVARVESARIFKAKLGPAGLRGAIIAWHDGVLAGWGRAYIGESL